MRTVRSTFLSAWGFRMPPTVILADDHPDFVAACRTLLAADYDVVAEAHDGREALEALAEHRPDLIVLDLAMPGVSGLEVLEALQAATERPAVVVLSLHQEPAVVERILDLGASAFVAKARMARDLHRAMRAALAGETFRSPV